MNAPTQAVVSMLTASGVPADRIELTNQVPPAPAYPYQVVSVTRDRPAAYLVSAQKGLTHFRIIVQSFGQTPDGASDYDTKAATALLDQRPTITGVACGPCVFDVTSGFYRDPDDQGVIGITTTYTFTTI